ncbi:MAG: restriction endonuclease subunit S [Butyricicoccus pullicaecorum]|nr:restriction endonuclease subunit S [Butyricicoccus pullicaecorum]
MSENNKPSIRFKGFTEAWEQRKLGEVGTTFTGLSGKTASDFGHGEASFITYMNVFSNPITNPNMVENVEIDSRQREVEVGDVFFTISSETPEEVGMSSVLKEKQGVTYLNSFCFGFRPTVKFDLDYLAFMLRSESVRKQIKLLAQGISRFNISKTKMMDIDIQAPSLDEQVAIGKYFEHLDHLITLHRRKHDKLVNVKKSMLEKMFPRDGKNVPEIRFSGFTEVWEQRKFGEMADYKKGPFGSALKKEIFVPKSENSVKVYEQQNAINKNWKLERYFITKEYAAELKGFETHGGDILVSCAGTIGEMYELPDKSEVGVINQALMRVRVNEKVISKKLYQLLFSSMIDDFSKEHSNGSAMKNIPPFADLKAMDAMVPTLEEQKRIGIYFEQLDHLITLHQREIEKLKNIKKSCLEKMFV